jgi:hypothetical protein
MRGHLKGTPGFTATKIERKMALRTVQNADIVLADCRARAAIIEQRLSMFAIYANSILSAHEAALESRNSKNSRLWGQPFTIENMLDMLEAAITRPPSKSTLAKLREPVEAETAFRRGNGEQ